MADFNEIMNTLIAGDMDGVISQVKSALEAGDEAKDILNQGLIQGMDIVGERMESGEMFIPEVLRCAKVMSAAVEILKPMLGEDSVTSAGKIVIGTVKGDLHDIGKNLVRMMLESSGFEVNDLGVDVGPETFVNGVRDTGANILGLSALLTTTMPMMQQTIEALKESGLRKDVKVMVGGAPVTQKFAEEIGADGYASDAGSANKLAKSML